MGDYGDLAFLMGDTQAQDQAHQAGASASGTSQASTSVLRLAVGIVAASVILLWLLGMSFR